MRRISGKQISAVYIRRAYFVVLCDRGVTIDVEYR